MEKNMETTVILRPYRGKGKEHWKYYYIGVIYRGKGKEQWKYYYIGDIYG